MTPSRNCSTLNDEWEEIAVGSYVSPLVEERPVQTLIFSDFMKDGSLRADITPLKGAEDRRYGDSHKEGRFVFRYTGAEGYYYAGLSAFGTKFFIAKVIPGPVYQLLGAAGQRSAIQYGTTYRLRVDCTGSQISLYENDVRQVLVYDDTHLAGQWGLSTWRTSARFDNVDISITQPQCFVVMPFASELSFVYHIIKETVEAHGLTCVRADEIMLSRPVVEDLKTLISQADLVIVDFTGKNPNVYYEAGIADAWKKKWIVLAQSSDDLTFDVRHIRTILYSNTMGADVKLRQNLSKAIREAGYTRLGSEK